MICTCTRTDLNDAVKFAAKAVAEKSPTPIISGMYMRAAGNTLEIQANNFSLGIIAKIPASVEVEGETAFLAKGFPDIVMRLQGDTVTIAQKDEDNFVTITSEAATFSLLTMKAEDFPKVKSQETLKSFRISSPVLKNAIRRTVFACAKENDARPIFTGCCFDIQGNDIFIAATNTHRLSIVKSTIPDAVDELKFIVPAATLKSIVPMLEYRDTENFTTIEYSGKYVTFNFDFFTVSSRIIEGQFPPHDKVIPASTSINVVADVGELRKVVERVELVSKETEYNTIRFVFTQDGIDISSEAREFGRAEEHISADVDGADIDISFNVKYILDVLRVLESDTFRIGLNQPLYPVDIREVGNDDFIYVLTPVRTTG